MAISLAKMYQVTPQNIRRNSTKAVVRLRKRGKAKRYARLGDTYEVVYQVKCTEEWRNVTLRFLGDKKNPPAARLGAPVWVRCSCPWFLYNCEYALTKNGSSWIHYCNGEPANQTNPKNIPFVCKHVYALQSSIRKYKMDAPPQVKRQPRQPKPAPKNRAVEQVEQQAEQAIEQVEQQIEQQQAPAAPKSALERVKDKLETIIDRMSDDEGPTVDKAVREVKTVINEIKDEGVKALTNNRIVRKLNDLINRFRGY